MSGVARPRARIAFAAPLPRGAEAEAEPVDVYLAERLTVAEMRQRAAAGLPQGFRLVDLEDEWVGAPSLASRVRATRYRAEVSGPGGGTTEAVASGRLRSAAQAVSTVEHGRASVEVEVWDARAGRGVLRIRIGQDPAGRPVRPADAVEDVGLGLRIARLVRTAVEIADQPRGDLPDGGAGP